MVTVAGMAMLLAVACAGPALAADGRLGADPWFPLIDPESPQETFEHNTLGIVRVGDGGWRANRGKYRSLLDRHDFFVTVGRTDLARHQARSTATSNVMFWSGIASVGAGGLLLYAHASEGGFDPSIRPALICIGGGLLATWISTWITGPSIASEEADEMAQRYNEQLKAHIENEVASPRPQPVRASAPPPSLVPWADGRTAGGLLLRMAF